MELKEEFAFTLSDELKDGSAIVDFTAIKREEGELYEVGWETEEGYDYVLYGVDSVISLIKEGSWKISKEES